MEWNRRTDWVLAALLLMVAPIVCVAQVTTTTVTDTIYHADGTAASGLVIVSWPAFTTAAGQPVAGGSSSVTIARDGVLTVKLTPNQGATPAGIFYTAVYHLDDGAVSREYWTVPVSMTAVSLSTIRAQALPATVAVQTASKSYVDSAVTAALAGHPPTGGITFLNRTGDAMVGPLALAGDPTTSSQAANKHYVDTAVAGAGTGLAQKIGAAPTASQIVIQPSGTQMQVNRLNSVGYASQYVTGRGGNGIANALGASECGGGCQVAIEQSYDSPEVFQPARANSNAKNGTHVQDLRGGGRQDSFVNPMNQSNGGFDVGQSIDVVSTRSAANVFQTTTSRQPTSVGLSVTHEAFTGGQNQLPATIAGNNAPYFKSNYLALAVEGVYNTMGQHVLAANTIHCYGVGDCLIGSQFMTAAGGFRDEADEGAHPMDLQFHEDTKVFTGSCKTGCAPGSMTLGISVTAGAGTQGEGRFLLDVNPVKTITAGSLTGGARTANNLIGPTATFSGSTFPTSIFLRTAQTAPASATSMMPGTLTLALATSGLPSVFKTTTAALPTATGVACVVDPPAPFDPTNYEMAAYRVVDASHLSLTLTKVHASGSTIAVGGLCGYGLEQVVDTKNGIRQVFPVIGSDTGTTLFYAGSLTPVVGAMGLTSGYVHVELPIVTAVRAGQTVTATTSAPLPADLNGFVVTISGMADASFNGQATISTTGATTLNYASAGPDASSSGGTLIALTGGYTLYPMAEVLGVYNAATKAVDGQLTLAANTVAWSPGDPVEEPHYFQENVMADSTFVGQSVPRAVVPTQAGIQYEDTVGPGLRGWSIQNAAPASNYFGNGGTHGAPDEALQVTGVWNRTMEAQAGETSAFRIHCNSHGCGRWNSAYNLFELDSSGGTDVVTYQPVSSGLTFTLRGTSYGFSPQGFTAGAVTAGSMTTGALTATALTAGGVTVNGSSRMAGGTTIFGSGAPLLTGANQEAYLQALSSGTNSAGVFVSRATPASFASLDLVTGPTGNTGWSLQMQPGSTDAVLADRAVGSAAMDCQSGGVCTFPRGILAKNFNGILSGSTSSLGGVPLTAGACASSSVAVSGATVGVPVVVSAADGSLPSGSTMLSAAVTGAGTVTVQVCAISATTPSARSYNVRVLQ